MGRIAIMQSILVNLTDQAFFRIGVELLLLLEFCQRVAAPPCSPRSFLQECRCLLIKQRPPSKARCAERAGAAPRNKQSRKTVSEKCSPLVPLPSPPFYSLRLSNSICYTFDGLEEPSGPWSTRYFSSLGPSKSLGPPKITAASLLFKVSHQREGRRGEVSEGRAGGEGRGGRRLKHVSIALLWADQSGPLRQPHGTIMVWWSQSESPRCSRCCNTDD